MRRAIERPPQGLRGDPGAGRRRARGRRIRPLPPAGVHVRAELLHGPRRVRERAAVTPGQGQAVTIAGVQVGQVGGVSLDNGRAVVTMNIYKQYAPIYRNATVLLRPRTPLKDMYLALDPGTKQRRRGPGRRHARRRRAPTPDVDLDQILSSLDADTRNYLLLLLAGGARRVQDPGATGALQPGGRRCAARSSGSRRSTATRGRSPRCSRSRSDKISRAIHNLACVATALGGVDGQLASLIQLVEHELLRDLLPGRQPPGGALAAARDAAADQPDARQGAGVRGAARPDAPAAAAVRARAGAGAERASQPLFHDTTPVIREPAAAVLGRRPAAGEGAGAGGHRAVERRSRR